MDIYVINENPKDESSTEKTIEKNSVKDSPKEIEKPEKKSKI